MKRRNGPGKGATAENGLIALQRAARKARELAQKTGTPFYVLREGKIVDLIAEETNRNAKNKASDRK